MDPAKRYLCVGYPGKFDFAVSVCHTKFDGAPVGIVILGSRIQGSLDPAQFCQSRNPGIEYA